MGRRRLPERSSERCAVGADPARCARAASPLCVRDSIQVASSLGLMEDALSRRERLDHRVYSKWLDAAIQQAQKSWNEGGIPIGSVLVNSAENDGRGAIVSAGENMRV